MLRITRKANGEVVLKAECGKRGGGDPHAVRRLYLAIVNRAILDILENGQESREAKRWLSSRDFDSLQAPVD
jgi:hypothetical protein